MTQSDLAERLGVSVAAVSKWEQGFSSPDISLLPMLSDIFSVSIDTIFGRDVVCEPIYDLVGSLPWDDDSKFRIAIFYGQKLMQQSTYVIDNGINQFDFRFDSPSRINGVCKFGKE